MLCLIYCRACGLSTVLTNPRDITGLGIGIDTSGKVSGNWRMTFAFAGKDVERGDYEDYH